MSAQADIEAMEGRLAEVNSEIDRLTQEMKELERAISGGSGWTGTFAELFGSECAFYMGTPLVPEKTYRGQSQAQILRGALWASSFGGPSHCQFAGGEMPVVMRGAVFIRKYAAADVVKRFLRRFRVTILTRAAYDEALEAAVKYRRARAERWGKASADYESGFIYAVCAPGPYAYQHYGLSPKWHGNMVAVVVNGVVVTPCSLAKSKLKRSINHKRYERMISVADRFSERAAKEERRRKNGRHCWAEKLRMKAAAIRQSAEQYNMEEKALAVAEKDFEGIIKFGRIDEKMMRLVSRGK